MKPQKNIQTISNFISKVQPFQYNGKSSFYYNIRPIAIPCKIISTFPLKNSLNEDGRFLGYRLLSVDAFWGLILNLACITLYYKYISLPL